MESDGRFINLENLNKSDFRHHDSDDELEMLSSGLYQILEYYQSDLLRSDATISFVHKHHYILLLTLALAEHCDLTYNISHRNYRSQKPVKEIEDLYNMLIENRNQPVKISIKIGHRVKIESQVLAKWICEKLIQAFEDFDIPMSFGDTIFLLSSKGNPLKNDSNYESLRKLKKPPMSSSKAIFYFCDNILAYLNKNFEMKAHGGSYISDLQVAFFYELLRLFDFDGFTNENPTQQPPTPTDIDRLYQLLIKTKKLIV